MKINQTIETEDGGVKFEGELSSKELDLVISVGLNFLMKQGAIPFVVVKKDDKSTFVDGNETEN